MPDTTNATPALKTVSNYKVEYRCDNTPADAPYAFVNTVAAATEDELNLGMLAEFRDDEDPETDTLATSFEVPFDSPGFGKDPVSGRVLMSGDKVVCTFTITRQETFEVPQLFWFDNDDSLMGQRVTIGSHLGTVIAAGLDETNGSGVTDSTAIVIVRCDDGEFRVSPREDAQPMPTE